MPLRLNMDDFGEIITVNNTLNKHSNQANHLQKHFHANFQELILSDAISVIKWELESQEDLEIVGSYESDAVMCLRLGLEGGVTQVEEHSHSTLELRQNDISCISMQALRGKEMYNKNTKHKIIDIYVKQDFLQKHFCQEAHLLKPLQTSTYKLLRSKKSFAKTLACAHNIFNTPFDDSFNELFVYGNTLELLSFELQALLSQQVQNKNVKFSDYDLEALEKAKTLLIQNMQNPPSIKELATKVHLNEFKLKYGFKSILDTTPYGFLLEHRMQEAHKLLQESELNITEIANAVGYKQASNFSKAFVKKFGVLPKELLKQRSYYY